MGGFGSINYLLNHPEQFAAWGGLVALLDFPNPAYPKDKNHSVPSVLGRQGEWAAVNPISRVEKLREHKLFFLTAEKAFDRDMNEAFAQALAKTNIEHEYRVVPGAHTFDVVADAFPNLMDFLDSNVTR